jgi:TRAP-type mannitol/chloroaromatic compound transport system permease small subunit
VSAQNTTWLNNIADGSLDLLGTIVVVLSGLALVVFLWGMVMFIRNSGNEQDQTVGKKRMIWGVVELFVLVSVWGLVQLLQAMFGVNGAATVPEPGVNFAG